MEYKNIIRLKLLVYCICLLFILFPQKVLSDDCRMYKYYAYGGVSIEKLHNFRHETTLIIYESKIALNIMDIQDILNKKQRFSEKIKRAENGLNKIFERLKCYEGKEDLINKKNPSELDYNAYKYAIHEQLNLLKSSAEIYLKIGEYYGAMGKKKEAKKTYRHIIINYTEDAFKSYVKEAEFALKDLEEK